MNNQVPVNIQPADDASVDAEAKSTSVSHGMSSTSLEEVRPTSTPDAGSATFTNLRPTRAPVAEEPAIMTLLEFEAYQKASLASLAAMRERIITTQESPLSNLPVDLVTSVIAPLKATGSNADVPVKTLLESIIPVSAPSSLNPNAVVFPVTRSGAGQPAEQEESTPFLTPAAERETSAGSLSNDSSMTPEEERAAIVYRAYMTRTAQVVDRATFTPIRSDDPGQDVIRSMNTDGFPPAIIPSVTPVPARHADSAPAPSGAPINIHEVMNTPVPTVSTTIARSHPDFTLNRVSPKAYADFYTNCSNALSVDITFNPVTRLANPIKARMLEQETIRQLRASMRPGDKFPRTANVAQMDERDLYNIGMRGTQGFKAIMQMLVGLLGRPEEYEEDITAAFKQHRLNACTAEDIKSFNVNIRQNATLYFKLLNLPCDNSLSKSILAERWATLRRACHSPCAWFEKFNAAVRNCETEPDNAANSIDVFTNLISFTLEHYEKQEEGFGRAKSFGAINESRQPNEHRRERDRRHSEPSSDRGRPSDTRYPRTAHPRHQPRQSQDARSTSPHQGWQQVSRSRPPRTDNRSTSQTRDPSTLTCFHCGKTGVRSGHPGCAHADAPSPAGLAARAAARERGRNATRAPYLRAAQTPVTAPVGDRRVAFQMAMISRHQNHALVHDDSESSMSSDDEGPPPLFNPSTKAMWTTDDDDSDDSDDSDDNEPPGLTPLKPRNDTDGIRVYGSSNDPDNDDEPPPLVPVSKRHFVDGIRVSEAPRTTRVSQAKHGAAKKRLAKHTKMSQDPTKRLKHPALQPLPYANASTVEFITPIVINDKLTSGLWDTAACNGNWIMASEANRLGLSPERVKTQTFASPLFPGTTFESTHAVLCDLDFPRYGFILADITLRILNDPEATQETPIILGQDLINMYGILNYIVQPLHYKSVDGPVPAPEETLDTENTCVLPFSAAILDPSSIPNMVPIWHAAKSLAAIHNATPYNYDTDLHIGLNFPLRQRALAILNKYDGTVLVDKLVNSSIDYEPMMATLKKPFNGVPPRRMNSEKQAYLDIWILEALERKLIRRSNSNQTSPLLLVPKSPGVYRVTQDVSVLNTCLENIYAHIPVTRELIQKIGAHKYYFQFDMVDCFYQFRVDPSVSKLYAFSTHKGNFEYTDVLPQGEKNAPAWVNNAMAHLLAPVPFMNAYFDDHATGNDDPSLLLDRLEQYLELCLKLNIKLARKKVKVGMAVLDTLGFLISKEGYRPRAAQIEKFLAAPMPNKDQLRSWFGLLNVFRDFLPDMTKVETAFSDVRKKNAPYIVTSPMRNAFEYAKQQVASIDLLLFPDDAQELFIDADASQFGCGAMLYQYDADRLHKLPLRFMAHIFTTQAVKWSTIEKECYALVRAFMTFENLLLGRSFRVRTDHRNLLWMQHSINAKVQRWFCYLYQFDFALEHIPGVDNVVADALSRIFAAASEPSVLLAPHPNAYADSLSRMPPLTALPASPSMLGQITPVDEWTYDRAESFFKTMHSELTSHPSLKNTLVAFKTAKCIFPQLKQQVIRWLAACPVCTKARAQRLQKPQKLEYHTVNSFQPFADFQMDFLTGLPLSKSGMNVLLVMVCSFSRFTILYPCPDQTAESACNGLLFLWGLFSAPHSITTDGASCFIAEEFQKLCAMLRITSRVGIPYHHKQVAIGERVNAEVIAIAQKIFASYDSASQETWDKYIPAVQRVINTRPHLSLGGAAPCQVVFGSVVTDAFDALSTNRADISLVDRDTPIPKYVRDLDEVLKLTVEYGLMSAEDRIIKNFNMAPTRVAIPEGTYCYARNLRPMQRKLGKFAPNYCGPFCVIKDYGSDIYQLRDVVQDTETYYMHASDLVISSITDEDTAKEIARGDYKEYFVQEVISHDGDPSKLGQLTFEVRFTGDNHTISCPFSDVQHVDVVKDYITKHKVELATAFKQISRAAAPLGTRSRKQSQRLAGYDLNVI